MYVKLLSMRRATAILISGAAILLPGCGSHEVTMPRVTEESLTPEQKAQFERMQNAQAEAFRKAGANQPVVMTPQEYAQQQFEAQKKEQEGAQANEGDAAPAEGAAGQ